MLSLKEELNQAYSYYLNAQKLSINTGSWKKDDDNSLKRENSWMELKHVYRKVIANGDLEGGNAKHMKDIDVHVTTNGSAKVLYKGVLLGFYSDYSKLIEIRNNIDKWLKEDWFKKGLEKLAS